MNMVYMFCNNIIKKKGKIIMKKIYALIIFIILLIACTGCKANNNFDLEDLYEKNFKLASNHFFGWGANDFKYELIIFEPENANEFEVNHFSTYFSEGIEKLLYMKYERQDMIPYIVAIQYESVELARQFYSFNSVLYIRNQNIVAIKIAASYMLLYGEYKEVDGYWLSLDGKVLLFDNQGQERVTMVIPEGVKIVPTFSVISTTVKTIKCNSELEILYTGAFAYFSSLEKIELNDGLKEIWTGCFTFHNLDYVVIPESVEKIEAEAFQNVTIYCEASKIPWGWNKDFALNNCVVYWGGTWEYVDGVPQPIVSEVELA